MDINDRFEDVKAYIHQAKLAQQAGVPKTVPWPPLDDRLRHRCADAYYLEQIAIYEGWIKLEDAVIKHIDLTDFNAWRTLPGRQDLYNRRKALKAEWEKNQPKSVGLSAATNPFAPAAAKAAEQARTAKAAEQAMDGAVSAEVNASARAMREANPGMTINFIDGTPSIPGASIVQRGDGQQNVFVLPPVRKQPPPPPPVAPPVRLEIAPEEPRKRFDVPLVNNDIHTAPTEQPSLADIMSAVRHLQKENSALKRQLAAANPITISSPGKKIKQEPGTAPV